PLEAPIHTHASHHARRDILLHIIFCFNATAPTEIYTLSLHDALPIWCPSSRTARCRCRISPTTPRASMRSSPDTALAARCMRTPDRKSTRLNSSHSQISYAVFCLKKKKKHTKTMQSTQHTINCSHDYT